MLIPHGDWFCPNCEHVRAQTYTVHVTLQQNTADVFFLLAPPHRESDVTPRSADVDDEEEGLTGKTS